MVSNWCAVKHETILILYKGYNKLSFLRIWGDCGILICNTFH